MRYVDLYPKDLKPQHMYCDHCKTYLRLQEADYDETIEDIRVQFRGLLLLHCDKCARQYFPERSRLAIMWSFEEALKAGQKRTHRTRRPLEERFLYCKVDFEYSADDYYHLPGLTRKDSPGFLTPVFFNRSVLTKFDNWPGYQLSFASGTYGSIAKLSGVEKEFDVAFGINRKNHVVMWLGDIDQLPPAEQHYLRSENIPSDHDIGSEFYDGQIECIFTEVAPEYHVTLARSWFASAFEAKLGKKPTKMDDETLALIEDLRPPVNYTDKEMKNTVDLLNKVCVESLDTAPLQAILREQGGDPAKLGGLKLLQAVLSNAYPGGNVPANLSGLFVLYDLRVVYSHLTPTDKRAASLESACERLAIPKGSDPEIIFRSLIRKLIESFDALARLLDPDGKLRPDIYPPTEENTLDT